LICLRRGETSQRVAKQPEAGLAGLRTILSIDPDLTAVKSATASIGYPRKGRGRRCSIYDFERGTGHRINPAGEGVWRALQPVIAAVKEATRSHAHPAIRRSDQLSGSRSLPSGSNIGAVRQR
jgi:hypothetical protein